MPRLKAKPRLDTSFLDPEDLDLLAASALGDRIGYAITNKASPLAMMMARAREEYVRAIKALIDVPLQTAEGLAQATLLQAHAARYRDMCQWLLDGLDDAEAANTRLAEDQIEDEAVEDLKEQIHGKRNQPAPDA